MVQTADLEGRLCVLVAVSCQFSRWPWSGSISLGGAFQVDGNMLRTALVLSSWCLKRASES